MALSLAVDGHHRESSVERGQGRNPPTVAEGGGGGDDGSRVPRLPRWTRQEILVLIQGKRVAENRVRRGRTAGMALGTGQIEPKWAAVSSYCKRHGVNRGPVQCRKRWSNLAGDYKKIKEWESKIDEEGDSFWVMRNDLRREKKLPGFFDRDVYDILDGGVSEPIAQTDLVLALAPPPPDEVVDAVFDSGRTAATEDGLFSDFEQSAHDEAAGSPGTEFAQTEKQTPIVVPPPPPQPAPISEKEQPRPVHKIGPSQESSGQQPDIGASSKEGGKRKRADTDEEEERLKDDAEASLESRLMKVLERNGKMLSEQLENQNNNFMLEREQRKDLVDGLVGVLNKLADAFGRIADKL
ncbi:trihelix transcription factor ASR3 [Impatiens glandulifera]|uniref:trihelix transcription factor ASR3 n=1 Tax=Impatiens glandulifera TaxID=253017 RepID=UPI001FB09B07|nr:trihelix transcription factor ASR3 [Impatiens glandulifera]